MFRNTTKKSTLEFIVIFFICVWKVSVAQQNEEQCDTCVPIEECPLFAKLSVEDQNNLVPKFSCQTIVGVAARSVPREFSSVAKGDRVCCDSKIWDIDLESEDKPAVQIYQNNNSKDNLEQYRLDAGNRNSFSNNFNNPQSGLSSDQSKSNFGYNTQNNPSKWTNDNNSNKDSNQNYNNFEASDDEASNLRQNRGRRPNGYWNGNTYTNNQRNNGGSRYNNIRNENYERCPFTIVPPEADTDCCGIEATESDRITAAPSRPSTPRPAQNPRRPNNNQMPTWIPPWISRLMRFRDDEEKASTPANDSALDTNVTITLDNRITGGIETELEQFPWTVLLMTTFNDGRKDSTFNCGGSLISSKYVLTAAHCVSESGSTVKGVDVYLAEFDKRTFPTDCVGRGRGRRCIENIIMKAQKIVIHSQYDDKRLQNDIALIKLRSSAPYTDFIRPICLPPLDIDDTDFSNIPLAVAGWGRNGQYVSDVKQSTVLNLVPQSECKRNYPFLTRRHLCAAGYRGEDTCKGDSGGPLMMVYRGKYYVSGIVSGKRADSPCGTSVPSLYTNVYQYLDWIHNNIN